ncbi:MAG: hypothetical protein IKG56_05360 [Clostridia bacterium]|nr:hypothetical protein [Clostridia bacterium]
MRNFLFNNENNDFNSGFDNRSNSNNSDASFLAELLSSDNTEILLFLIVFLLLFTSFGRR